MTIYNFVFSLEHLIVFHHFRKKYYFISFYVNSVAPLAENMPRSIVIYDFIVSYCESIRYSE